MAHGKLTRNLQIHRLNRNRLNVRLQIEKHRLSILVLGQLQIRLPGGSRMRQAQPDS
jgi:hypothetical protein